MKPRLLFAAISIGLCCSNAFAWDAFGHMVVADVAWKRLDQPTRDKVSTLLKRNPDYDSWVAGIAAADKDEFAFMRASVWADDIKSMDEYINDEPDDPKAASVVGYADVRRHKYWHYVDFPFSPDHTALGDPDPVNLETQLAALRNKLKSHTSNAVKSYALVWLLHLVGDAHQPLHATSRFTSAQPHGDVGGQGVKVCPTACEPTNPSLHTFWDNILGTSTNPKNARTAAGALAAADPALVGIPDHSTWLHESFDRAQSDAYSSPIKGGKGPYKITAAYRAKVKRIAEERVELAGERLARLIESSL